MKYSKIVKIGAVVLLVILLGSTIALPMSGTVKINKNSIMKQIFNRNLVERSKYGITEDPPQEDGPTVLDTVYIKKEDVSLAGEQNDIGYNVDAGDKIYNSLCN